MRWDKHAGLLSGIFLCLGVMLVSFSLKLNLMYFELIGRVPITVWFIVPVSLFTVGYFLKLQGKRLWVFVLILAYVSWVYWNSHLQWQVECCPEDYVSMWEWNASKGLTWIVDAPISLLIVITQGALFDFMINQKKNRTKN